MLSKLFGSKTKPDKKDKIGTVTHYYPRVKVAVVRFNKQTDVGTKVRFCGATTDFTQKVASLERNHKPRKRADKRKQFGVKVKKRVRSGDGVYLA